MTTSNPRLDEEEVKNIQEVIAKLQEWCVKELPLEEAQQLSVDLYTLHDNMEFDIKMMKEYNKPKVRGGKRT